MFPRQSFTCILVAFLSFSVQAFPLSHRDVIAPQILEPDATSVWPVGTQQIVIWDTTGIPPASQITNPTAKIILGFNESNSLNLDFNNPLAQNFLITDGNVTLTVPDVPPRDDYIIVLFGDSGDTSPAFAITRISSPAPGSSSPSVSSGSSADSPTVSTTSLSVTGSMTTLALTGSTLSSGDITTAPPPTGTTISSSSSISSSSNGTSAVTSAPAASSSASSGRSIHRGSSMWSSAAPLLMSVAPFVVVLMI